MLKKKNIAMVMAAATVATSVAPVFALESQKVDEATLVSEVEKKLAVKYTKEDLGSVYKVDVILGTDAAVEVKTVNELKKLIEKAEVEEKSVTVEIADKGHATVDGKVVNTVKGTTYDIALPTDQDQDVAKAIAAKVIVKENNSDATFIKNNTITLASGVQLVVNGKTAKLDFTKGLDKDGNKIDIASADEATAKRVVGFEVLAGTDETAEIAGQKVAKLVYNGIEAKTLEFNLSDFDTDYGYTQEGKDLLELLGKANEAKDDPKTNDVVETNVTTIVKNGKNYQVKFEKNNDLKLEAVKEGGYRLTVDLKVAEVGKDLPHSSNVQLVIKSNVQKDLVDFKKAIFDAKGTVVSAGKYEKLAGDTRFETAVAISGEAYKAKGEADAIVLVGENAVVDGLASAPLAKKSKAPILLTKKDSVPTETMKEIERLVEKGSKVYLIGGENTISKEVESQLIKEMNANIVRLAGDDRHDTSLKIAKELKSNSKKAFVVGGDGLADAMSVAAVAAKKGAESPIIVTPAEGLTRDAKAFLDDENNNIEKVDVVGGTTKVSTQVLKEIVEIKNATPQKAISVDRISGTDRNDTNARVIAKYFDKASTLTNVYVAKDADSQLIDALAVAPLAGETTKGAIVLATNELTKAQEKALDTAKDDTPAKNKLTQVGNGVASTVMQKVLKALGK